MLNWLVLAVQRGVPGGIAWACCNRVSLDSTKPLDTTQQGTPSRPGTFPMNSFCRWCICHITRLCTIWWVRECRPLFLDTLKMRYWSIFIMHCRTTVPLNATGIMSCLALGIFAGVCDNTEGDLPRYSPQPNERGSKVSYRSFLNGARVCLEWPSALQGLYLQTCFQWEIQSLFCS